jgi:hypothetical protein
VTLFFIIPLTLLKNQQLDSDQPCIRVVALKPSYIISNDDTMEVLKELVYTGAFPKPVNRGSTLLLVLDSGCTWKFKSGKPRIDGVFTSSKVPFVMAHAVINSPFQLQREGCLAPYAWTFKAPAGGLLLKHVIPIMNALAPLPVMVMMCGW